MNRPAKVATAKAGKPDRIMAFSKRVPIARTAKWIAIGGASLGVAAAAFVYSGLYDISATDEHTPPVYWLMEFVMRRSVQVRANEHPESRFARTATGEAFRLYHAHCVQCHGAPGVAPEPFALGLTPVPASLVATARNWSGAEIHWVVKYGVKMTGMPAWKYRMSEEQMIDVVAFVKNALPLLSPAQYREMMAANLVAVKETAVVAETAARSVPIGSIDPGDPRAGRRAIHQHACATCHVIPGVTGATQHVGPPLRGIATRAYIAGLLPNTTENMVAWLMFPQRISARTAMPDLGVSARDARDMAAFLATLAAE